MAPALMPSLDVNVILWNTQKLLSPEFVLLVSVGSHPNSWADCANESSYFTTGSVLQAVESLVLEQRTFLPALIEFSENPVGMGPWQGSHCSGYWM